MKKQGGSTTGGKTLNYSERQLTEMPSISYSGKVDTLNLSYNLIRDFTGLKQFESLNRLILDDTKLVSFKGFKGQNDLAMLSCMRTPLGYSKFFTLMSLIACGNSLKSANSININQAQRNMANVLRKQLRVYIQDGWLILNLNPVKLVNAETRKRKTIYIDYEEESKKLAQQETEESQQQETTEETSPPDDMTIYENEEKEEDQELKKIKPKNEEEEDSNDEEIRRHFNEVFTNEMLKTTPTNSRSNSRQKSRQQSSRQMLRQSQSKQATQEVAVAREMPKSPNQQKNSPPPKESPEEDIKEQEPVPEVIGEFSEEPNNNDQEIEQQKNEDQNNDQPEEPTNVNNETDQ